MDKDIIDYAKKQAIDLVNMKSDSYSYWLDLFQDLKKLADKPDSEEINNRLETINFDINDLYIILEDAEKFYTNLDTIEYEQTLFDTVHSFHMNINSIYRSLAENFERLKDLEIFKHDDQFGKKVEENFEKMLEELRSAKDKLNARYDYIAHQMLILLLYRS